MWVAIVKKIENHWSKECKNASVKIHPIIVFDASMKKYVFVLRFRASHDRRRARDS